MAPLSLTVHFKIKSLTSEHERDKKLLSNVTQTSNTHIACLQIIKKNPLLEKNVKKNAQNKVLSVY